jgi:hypothetical protein
MGCENANSKAMRVSIPSIRTARIDRAADTARTRLIAVTQIWCQTDPCRLKQAAEKSLHRSFQIRLRHVVEKARDSTADSVVEHSLRAGYCTGSATVGLQPCQIRKQTGHKSDVTIALYQACHQKEESKLAFATRNYCSWRSSASYLPLASIDVAAVRMLQFITIYSCLHRVATRTISGNGTKQTSLVTSAGIGSLLSLNTAPCVRIHFLEHVMVEQEFLDRYFVLFQKLSHTYSLNAPSDGEINGAFNLSELGVVLGFVNKPHLDWMGEALTAFESDTKSMSDEDLHRGLSPDELDQFLKKNTDTLRIVKLIEVTDHEHFHAIQAFTLRSVFQITKAFQRLSECRTMIAVMAMQAGATFSIGQPILAVINHMPENQKAVLSGLVRILDRELEILERCIEEIDGLTCLQLIEGAAYAAQRVASMAPDDDIFNVSELPLYSRAWDIWVENGGTERLCFLLAADIALRFGSNTLSLHKEYGPVPIFLSLAAKAGRIESLLESKLSLPSGKFGWEITFMAAYENKRVFDYLRPHSTTNEAIKRLLETYTMRIPAHINRALLEFSEELLLEVPDALRGAFIPIDRGDVTADYSEKQLQVLGNILYDKMPALGTQQFLLCWLTSMDCRRDFGMMYTEAYSELSKTKMDVMHVNLLTEEYLLISRKISDFEQILLYSIIDCPTHPYCCNLHGRTRDLDLLDACEQLDSLKAFTEQICQRNLSALIDNFN